MEGVEKLDMHKAVSVIFPKEVEKQLGIDMDAAVDLVEDSLLGGIAEEFGDEADLSIDYKITETEQCTEDEIEDMEERYNDALHTDIRFKDAKRLEVETEISAGGEQEESTEDIAVIKIGNKWYINIVELI